MCVGWRGGGGGGAGAGVGDGVTLLMGSMAAGPGEGVLRGGGGG